MQHPTAVRRARADRARRRRPARHSARARPALSAVLSERCKDFGHFLQFRINSYQLSIYNYEFREFGCM